MYVFWLDALHLGALAYLLIIVMGIVQKKVGPPHDEQSNALPARYYDSVSHVGKNEVNAKV